MPYIGNTIRAADDYRLIDDISSGFNGSTTSFALQVAGSAPVPFPKSPQQVLISVNGVIQEPDPTGSSGFNLVGTNIVFSSAPTNGHAFFGIIYATADYLNAGGNFPAGSLGAPSITFIGDENSGLFRKSGGSVGFVSDATEIANFDSNGITISSGNLIIPDSIIHNGDTNTKIRFPAADTVTIETAGNEAFRIDSGGDVGINLTDPTAKLHIVESTSIPAVKIKSGTSTNQNASLTFQNDNEGGLLHLGVFGSSATTFGANEATDGFITANNQLAINSQNASGAIRFGIGSTPNTKMLINSSGKVGIGTTAPTDLVDLYSSSHNQRLLRLSQATSPTGAAGFIGFNSDGTTDSNVVTFGVQYSSNYHNVLNIKRSTQFVGIGTTNPSQHLHVAANVNSDEKILVVNSNTGSSARSSVTLQSDSSTLQLYATSAAYSGVSSWGDSGVLSTGSGTSGGLIFNTQASSSAIKFQTQTNERMRIDSSGRVMIGVTSTGHASGNADDLCVGNNDSSSEHGITIGSTVAGGIRWADSASGSAGVIEYVHSDNRMTFSTDANERMRIDGHGRLFLGTTNTVLGSSGVFGEFCIREGTEGAAIHMADNDANVHAGFFTSDNSNFFVIRTITNHPMIFRTNNTERMRITNDGNFLINTTTAIGKLTLKGTNSSGSSCYVITSSGKAGQGIDLNSTTVGDGNFGGAISFGCGGNGRSAIAGVQVGSDDDRNGLAFFTHSSTNGADNASEQMRINADGEVRIGDELTTAHGGLLQVVHTGAGNLNGDNLIYLETNSNDWIVKTNYEDTGIHYHMNFMEHGTIRGTITGNDGQNVSFTPGSDYRWKENVVDLTGTEGISLLKNLKPRKYNWIDNRLSTGKINTVNGFIAHEVEEAGIAHLVYGNGKDAVFEDGSIDGQTLDYAGMAPVLAAAIKGLIDKVETLETKVAALEAA